MNTAMDTKPLTVAKAASLYENSTCFKMQFVVDIVQELGVSQVGCEISENGFYGFHLILSDLQKEISAIGRTITEIPLKERKPSQGI